MKPWRRPSTGSVCVGGLRGPRGVSVTCDAAGRRHHQKARASRFMGAVHPAPATTAQRALVANKPGPRRFRATNPSQVCTCRDARVGLALEGWPSPHEAAAAVAAGLMMPPPPFDSTTTPPPRPYFRVRRGCSKRFGGSSTIHPVIFGGPRTLPPDLFVCFKKGVCGVFQLAKAVWTWHEGALVQMRPKNEWRGGFASSPNGTPPPPPPRLLARWAKTLIRTTSQSQVRRPTRVSTWRGLWCDHNAAHPSDGGGPPPHRFP